MAFQDLRFTVMTFPQEWAPGTPAITANVLLLPTGDPTGPIPNLAAPRSPEGNEPSKECSSRVWINCLVRPRPPLR